MGFDFVLQVKQYKKENLVPPKDLKRLALFKDAQPVFAVFVPMPTEQTSLAVPLAILKQLKAVPAGSRAVLMMPDWSAFCLGRLGGDMGAIRAWFATVVEVLKLWGMPADVVVWMQSAAILSNPSDYWISVINVGRTMQVDQVLAGVRQPGDDSTEMASQVVAGLMHVGDVLGTGATVLCGTKAQSAGHEFVGKYYAATGITEVPTPTVEVVDCVSLTLQPDTLADNADREIYLLDNDMDLNRKIKKAFCEPGNAEKCPPIDLADELIFQQGGTLTVERKPDNGGNSRA